MLRKKSFLILYFYNFLVLVLFVFALQLSFFTELNILFTDRLQGNIKVRNEIIVVGIDDYSLQEIGSWPWKRDIFTKAVNNLKNEKPRVVGIDVLFLEKRDGDDTLKSAIQNAGFPVVLASKEAGGILLESYLGGKNGFVNFEPDSDGKIRRSFVSQTIIPNCEASFTFVIVKEYLGSKEPYGCSEYVSLNKSRKIPRNLSFNYTNGSFTYISFKDLLNGKFFPGFFTNKIVLIGSTALDLRSNLNDNFIDVFGQRISGILIHANIINSFLENKFQTDFPLKWFYIFIFVLSNGLLYLYSKLKRSIFDFALFSVVLFLVILLGISLFDFGVNWPFVHSAVLLTASYIFFTFYKYFVEQRENKFIQKAFNRYINPNLLYKLKENPESLKLGGEKKEMTVLFSDVRGFTSLSEKLSPEDLIQLMNTYLNEMSEVILKNNGTIDKFIGDAIMAFWNAPLADSKHRLNAIKTSMEMVKHLKDLGEKFDEFKTLKVGIGINTGDMIVGNVGSNSRFDYTVIGDNVNVGSRIEGLTKKYGVSVIVSEFAISNLHSDCGIIFRVLDEVIVKGKTKPFKIYEPLEDTEANRNLKEKYEKGFVLYQKKQFKKAVEIFESLEKDCVSHKMIERINELGKVRNWDGVWTWLDK